MKIPPIFKRQLLILIHSSRVIIKLVIVDQLVKWWFINSLINKPDSKIKITSFFEIVYSWNHGISFGLFGGYTHYSNVIFIFLNILITTYLWYQIYKFKSSASFMGYSFIVGGAIGNILDRILRGAVFDFIYFHYHDYGFPVFNVADAFISIGALILIYDHYKIKKSVELEAKTNYDALQMEADKIREKSSKDF